MLGKPVYRNNRDFLRLFRDLLLVSPSIRTIVAICPGSQFAQSIFLTRLWTYSFTYTYTFLHIYCFSIDVYVKYVCTYISVSFPSVIPSFRVPRHPLNCVFFSFFRSRVVGLIKGLKIV